MGVLATAAPPATNNNNAASTTIICTPNNVTPTCRIVSEQRKNKDANKPPSMYGLLEVRRLGRWLSRHAEIRPGELRVSRPAEGDVPRQLEMRLPLRRMSLLRADDLGRLAFSLEPQISAISPVQLPLLFRTRTQLEYDRWVRALAVELMRQTPLEALRFLDVFGITQTRPPPHPVVTTSVSAPTPLSSRGSHEERGSHQLARLLSADSIRCRLQGRRDDCPLPVRERRRVFEGLIAASSRTTSASTDNLACGNSDRFEYFSKRSTGLRARSLLDLRHGPPPVPVDYPRRSISIRELCRFFEQGPTVSNPSRPESPEEVCLNPFLSKRRVQRGQRRLTALRERAAAAEDAIWKLQEQMAELDRDHISARRNSKGQAESFLALERRLAEEERSLSTLQSETTRVLRSVEQAARRLDTALSTGRSWDTASSSGVSSDSG